MIPNPDTLSPETTVLDTLHLMHNRHYLHVPVVDEDNKIYGIVDVVEIVGNIMHGEAGELFWNAAYDNESDTGSLRSYNNVNEIRHVGAVRANSALSGRHSTISSTNSVNVYTE